MTNVNDAVVLDSVFGEWHVSAPVTSLQWHSGLDYVLAATESEVGKEYKYPTNSMCSIAKGDVARLATPYHTIANIIFHAIDF